MGHYFAARRRAMEEPDPGPPPLYLPRGTVRLLLLAGSIAVAMLLYQRGQLTAIDRNPGSLTLLLVGGFLLGVAMNGVMTWWKERGHRPPRFVEDLRAVVSLAAGGLLAVLVLNRVLSVLFHGQYRQPTGHRVHLGHLRTGTSPLRGRRLLLRLAILRRRVQSRPCGCGRSPEKSRIVGTAHSQGCDRTDTFLSLPGECARPANPVARETGRLRDDAALVAITSNGPGSRSSRRNELIGIARCGRSTAYRTPGMRRHSSAADDGTGGVGRSERSIMKLGNSKAAGRWDPAGGRTRSARAQRRRRPGCESLESRRLLTTITEYPLPSGIPSDPEGIVTGPDGNVWFTEPGVAKIGKINPATHAVTEISLPFGMTANSITASPDGDLWFTDTAGDAIGRLNPATGVVTPFLIPSPGAAPAGITSGPGGDLWFAESGTGRIGKLDPATGSITEFPISSPDSSTPEPESIAADSYGDVWFTDVGTGMIGEFNAATGAVEIPLTGTNNALSQGIVSGPNGSMWFTVTIGPTGNEIGMIDPITQAISLFPITSHAYPNDITLGPDGNLWFTESSDPVRLPVGSAARHD